MMSVSRPNAFQHISACVAELSSGTYRPTPYEADFVPCIYDCLLAGLWPYFEAHLHGPKRDMCGRHEPYEPSGPAMEPGEFIELELDHERDREYRERGCFEREQDAQRHQGKRDKPSAARRRPPCLPDGILGLLARSGIARAGIALRELPDLDSWRDIVGARHG